MTEYNSAKSPMEKGHTLSREGSNVQPHRDSLCSLTCATVCMERFQQSPTEKHWQSLKRMKRCLKGTAANGLHFKKNKDTRPFVGFVDNWAFDQRQRGCWDYRDRTDQH